MCQRREREREKKMSLATRESGRLAREISSSFPNISRETAFLGNHQLSSNEFYTAGELDQPGSWNENGLSMIFSSSGGRSNGQGRNGAIRDKIYEQDEKIEHLTRALKEKKKDKRKRKEREKKIEEARSILESTTSTFKVEEVKEECVNPFDIFPFAKEFKEKHPELIIEFAPPPEVPSFLAEDNVICFNPWCKDHLTRAEPKEEKREDPLTLHSLEKRVDILEKEKSEMLDLINRLESRIQEMEPFFLKSLLD